MRHIRQIVVHYSATRPNQHVTAAIVEGWHRARGFRAIGYHWFIRRDGTLEEGRPETQIGAHVAGHNSHTIGVCWAGGLPEQGARGVKNMTPAQEERIVWLIRQLLDRYPGAEVVGHKDLGATECPGFDVRKWWAEVGAAPAVDRLGDLERRVAALEARA